MLQKIDYYKLKKEEFLDESLLAFKKYLTQLQHRGNSNVGFTKNSKAALKKENFKKLKNDLIVHLHRQEQVTNEELKYIAGVLPILKQQQSVNTNTWKQILGITDSDITATKVKEHHDIFKCWLEQIVGATPKGKQQMSPVTSVPMIISNTPNTLYKTPKLSILLNFDEDKTQKVYLRRKNNHHLTGEESEQKLMKTI